MRPSATSSTPASMKWAKDATEETPKPLKGKFKELASDYETMKKADEVLLRNLNKQRALKFPGV